MAPKLEGHVGLVTGASRGIGRAVAIRLAADGAKIAVNYNSGETPAQEVVDEIIAQGGEAIAVQSDVSDEAQVKTMVAAVRKQWNRLDILVNNAGIRNDRLLMRMSTREWDDTLDVNLRGAFFCTKAVLPLMVRQRRGRIINMSSVVGVAGNPGQANYAASKAALIGLTKSVAKEGRPQKHHRQRPRPGLRTHRHGRRAFRRPEADGPRPRPHEPPRRPPTT